MLLDILVETAAIERTLGQVRVWLHEAYSQPDAYHGPEHAEQVLRLADDIARRIPRGLSPVERLIVSVAALLHDVGYTAHQPSWAPNRREHVPASIAFAQRHLAELSPFAQHPPLISAVAYLIGHHDDTGYKFPSFVWSGRVGSIDLGPYAAQLARFEAGLPPKQRERLHLMLAVVREADALTAAGSSGDHRTFQYAIHRGLPAFAHGNPLNAWCWEESAAGNTRLAAKRALIDAFTPEGKRLAWESYRATEAYLQGACLEGSVPYAPESISVAGDASHPPAIGRVTGLDHSFELISYAGWDSLERTIRDAVREHAPGVHPPVRADMSLRRLPLDLLPDASSSASPAMSPEAPHTAALASLQAHLLSEYALCLFDLTGIIECRLGSETMRVTPPIVERYSLAPVAAADSLVISGGAATVALARELGVPALWVAEVETGHL